MVCSWCKQEEKEQSSMVEIGFSPYLNGLKLQIKLGCENESSIQV